MSLDGYPDWPAMLKWLNAAKDRIETIYAFSAEQIITGELDPSVIPPIPWDRVLKADSSLADLETRSASVLSSGTLPAARMPALSGDVSSTSGATVTTLADVNGNAGTFGGSSAIPVVTVNAKGLITAVSVASVSAGGGDIKADGTVPFAADESMGGFNLTGVADPVAAQDAVTLAYLLAHYYEPLTNGDPVTPELIFDGFGDVIMVLI